MKAKIINNKVFCPICEGTDFRDNNGCISTKYGTKVFRKCNGCGEELEYYVKSLIEKQIRFIVEEEEE